jgi:hypothetical protein
MYIQIFIGNKFWGPLNQKKGETLRRLRIYHRQRNKSSASHITLVIMELREIEFGIYGQAAGYRE